MLEGVTPRGWVWGIGAGLMVLAVVAFWPAFFGEWLSWDDAQNFVMNERWRGLGVENLKWMWTTYWLGHYQPVTWMTFGAQWYVSGSNPMGYHAFNIVVHGVNGVLLFLAARRLLAVGFPGEQWTEGGGGYSKVVTVAAVLGAVLFLVHPLRVEPVAWITERRDVLSTAFLLGALLAYLRAVEAQGAGVRDGRWYWAAVVLALLSCASKAWGMSFFVVLMAVDMMPLRRVTTLAGWFTRDGLRVLVQKAPFAVIGLATAVLASRAQAVAHAAKPLEEYGVVSRVVQACYGLWFYVKQTVAPSTHSPLYEIPLELDPLALRFVLSYVFVVVLAGAAVWCWKRARGVTVAIALYVLLISPVLGVLQSGDQFVADRYSYLATIPFAVLLGAGVVVLLRRQEAKGAEELRKAGLLVGAVAAVATGAMVFASRAQSRVWRDSLTLWTYAAQVTPTAFVLCNWAEHFKHEDPVLARSVVKRATENFPTSGRAWWEYAALSRAAGDLHEAARAYGEGAKWLNPAWAAWMELGLVLREQGRLEEAQRALEAAVADNEGAGMRSRGAPHLNLARVLLERGDRAGAVAQLKKAAGHRDVRGEAERMLVEVGE